MKVISLINFPEKLIISIKKNINNLGNFKKFTLSIRSSSYPNKIDIIINEFAFDFLNATFNI